MEPKLSSALDPESVVPRIRARSRPPFLPRPTSSPSHMLPLSLAFLRPFLWRHAAGHSERTRVHRRSASSHTACRAWDALQTSPACAHLPSIWEQLRRHLALDPSCPFLLGGFSLSDPTPGSLFLLWAWLSPLLDCGPPEAGPSSAAFSLSVSRRPAPPHPLASVFSEEKESHAPIAHSCYPKVRGIARAGSVGDVSGSSLLGDPKKRVPSVLNSSGEDRPA